MMYKYKYYKYFKKYKKIEKYAKGDIIQTKNEIIYYQDRDKKWPFKTNEKGLELLLNLDKKKVLMMKENMKLLSLKHENNIDNIAKEIQKGYKVYSTKPTLYSTKHLGFGDSKKSVTWSIDEYSTLGFQRIYLKQKCFQRFTEAWTLAERLDYIGYFKNTLPKQKKICIVSIGGGPGYELFALDCYLKQKYKIKAKCISMDIIKTWGNYVPFLGANFSFINWDLDKGDFSKVIKQKIDYVIISNVFLMYMDNPKGRRFIIELLKKRGIKGVFINSRKKHIESYSLFEKEGVKCINLIDKNDSRQSLLTTSFTQSRNNKYLSSEKTVFPNVPFID